MRAVLPMSRRGYALKPSTSTTALGAYCWRAHQRAKQANRVATRCGAARARRTGLAVVLSDGRGYGLCVTAAPVARSARKASDHGTGASVRESHEYEEAAGGVRCPSYLRCHAHGRLQRG